jgi:hypothetical protein
MMRSAAGEPDAKGPRPPGRARAARACLVAVVALVAVSGVHAQHDEDDVKAALLYNIARFVEWPVPQDGPDAGPFVMGIVGERRFAEVLERTIAGRTVHHRAVQVLHIKEPAQLADCDLVFFAQRSTPGRASMAGSLSRLPVLVVGDELSACREGAALCFFTQQNRVRIASNVAAAEASGLRVSSQLLKLARPVEQAAGQR